MSFNIYYWTGAPEEAPDPECHVTPGFNTPTVISDEAVARFAEEYAASLGTDEKTIGGIIIRSAFDAIMCTEKCNGVGYVLCRDNSGSTGPVDKGAFMVLRGVNVTFDAETNEIRDVRKLDTPNFIAGYWCPPSFMQ